MQMQMEEKNIYFLFLLLWMAFRACEIMLHFRRLINH